MIYICTHTDFELPERIREGYRILSLKPLVKDYPIPVDIVRENRITPMQYAYAEGYHIWHIYAFTNSPWVGVNGYRKYFFDIPSDMTVLPVPRRFNMYKQYEEAHNIKDLELCLNIIDQHYPEYSCDYKSLQLMPCNMFQMRRYDFEKYCSFVYGVLDWFNAERNLHTDADVLAYVQSTQGQWTKHDAKYQSRLQGYLMERIGTIFFHKYFGVVNKKIHFVSDKIS